MIASERISDTRLLYPNEKPRSQTMMAWLPVERALSTTFFISHGERNWPFLMLTGLPWEDTFNMKLVCRHRNAGVCMTSTTAATSAIGVSSWTSVSTGTPTALRTSARIARPASIPGPLKLFLDERLALSYEVLNTIGIDSRVVIFFRRPAISCVSVGPSITQGPAIRKNGCCSPTSCPASFMHRPLAAVELHDGRAWFGC